MAVGLEIRRASDNAVIVSYTDRLGTIMGAVDTGGVNGSITVPGFALGSPTFKCSSLDGIQSYYHPTVTASGTTLSWTYKAGNYYKPNCRIIYAVY